MRRQHHAVKFLLLVSVLESLAWLPWTTPRIFRPIAPAHLKHPPFGNPSSWSPNKDRALWMTTPGEEGYEKLDLNLLIIDHYDSFTYNLADLLSQLCHRPPIVLAADCVDSWHDLWQTKNAYYANANWTTHQHHQLDGIILSPGPGRPETAGKLSLDAITANPHLPILGVCLGHQILGHVYGATIQLAPEPVHGQVRPVRIIVDNQEPEDDFCLWHNLTDASNNNHNHHGIIEVTRYHSLKVTDLNATNGTLIPTAVSHDDDNEEIIMAMRHVEYPHYGVQFHPESIGTPQGRDLLYNFCQICRHHKMLKKSSTKLLASSAASSPKLTFTTTSTPHTEPPLLSVPPPKHHQSSPPRHDVWIHKISHQTTRATPLEVMEDIMSAGADFAFWLDEAAPAATTVVANDQPSTAHTAPATAGVSILGSCSKHRIEYWGKEKPKQQQGLYVWRESGNNNNDTHCDFLPDLDILTYLQQEHRTPTIEARLVFLDDRHTVVTGMERYSEEYLHDILPFSFRGGHVGYLGYEVRHDTALFLKDQEHGRRHDRNNTNRPDETSSTSDPHVPTAAFLWADKSLVYDHRHGDWYLVGVSSDGSESDTLDWMKTTADKLCRWIPRTGAKPVEAAARTHLKIRPSFYPNRSRRTYNRNFAQCLEHIRQGDSYELCLTNQLQAYVPRSCASPSLSPFDLYKVLRRRNPAPFSAFLNWNSAQRVPTTDAELAICCSSPERFVSVQPVVVSASSTSTQQQPTTTTMAVNGDGDTNRVNDQKSAKILEFQVEAKPIKGTCARVQPSRRPNNNGGSSSSSLLSLTQSELAQDQARARSLQSSVKNRAENLMIVDLLRNDLSRVCVPGTVHVHKLMDIESFATVHQMVSTIRGRLGDSTALDVLKACFPGGSMTGAPKLRSMEILDEMEGKVCRGPYSGSLGYISLNGSMDMNILIRTAVLTPTTTESSTSTSSSSVDEWKVSIGAGGAITALSENQDEYEELMLKAAVVIQAVEEWATATTSSTSSSLINKETHPVTTKREESEHANVTGKRTV